MINAEMISTIKENGFKGIECKSIEDFINVLKTSEVIEVDIPGVRISVAKEEDNLNKGESYHDLVSGEITHYCVKTVKNEKFIYNDELEAWADSFLISGGQPDRKNITLMGKNGFNVYAGEADSFGWLTGILETKLGKLVFG